MGEELKFARGFGFIRGTFAFVDSGWCGKVWGCVVGCVVNVREVCCVDEGNWVMDVFVWNDWRWDVLEWYVN